MMYRYVGRHGAFHEGIPARDLTAEDVAALPAGDATLVRHSPLYEVVAPPAPAPEPESEPEPEPEPEPDVVIDEPQAALDEIGEAESAPRARRGRKS